MKTPRDYAEDIYRNVRAGDEWEMLDVAAIITQAMADVRRPVELRAEEAERAVTSLRSMLLRAENARDEWKAKWEEVFVDRAKLSNQLADTRRTTIDNVLRVLGRYGLRASGIEDNIRALLDDASAATPKPPVCDHGQPPSTMVPCVQIAGVWKCHSCGAQMSDPTNRSDA